MSSLLLYYSSSSGAQTYCGFFIRKDGNVIWHNGTYMGGREGAQQIQDQSKRWSSILRREISCLESNCGKRKLRIRQVRQINASHESRREWRSRCCSSLRLLGRLRRRSFSKWWALLVKWTRIYCFSLAVLELQTRKSPFAVARQGVDLQTKRPSEILREVSFASQTFLR